MDQTESSATAAANGATSQAAPAASTSTAAPSSPPPLPFDPTQRQPAPTLGSQEQPSQADAKESKLPGFKRVAPYVGAGLLGLLLMRSYLLAGNGAHYDGVIAALEARGLAVIPAFASGLDARPAIEKFFMHKGQVAVDAVLLAVVFDGHHQFRPTHVEEVPRVTVGPGDRNLRLWP